MTIYKSAYDTVACSNYKTDQVSSKVKLAIDSMNLAVKQLKLYSLDLEINLCLITGGNPIEDNIGYFYHPIFITTNSKEYVVVDVRNFGKWYDPQKTFIVRNQPEYDWSIKRAILSYIWRYDRVEPIRDLSTMVVAAYSSLISESVARRFALDPAEQITISVLSAYFYNCLCSDHKQFTEDEYNRIVSNITRALRVPAQDVYDILENMPAIDSLVGLCDVIKQKADSVRLQDFNVGVLIAVVSGNWFGTNARENLACAMEHVPTWVMICAASIDERTFKRSVLAKLVEKVAKGDKGTSFIKSLNSLIRLEKELD